MAEPLKNMFGPDVPERIADMIRKSDPSFDEEAFLSMALEGYEDLELTPRARHIADALAATLPDDRGRAMQILIESLGPEIEGSELTGMDSFLYLPYVFFISDHGLDEYDLAMTAQYEVTKRFTAEFSIRAFLDRYPERTLAILAQWAHDENVHVRRLVSEGTRPRLPWAPRLRRFQEDPTPVIELIEMLKDDPEEYVRRSVANNINDISKDHPEVVVQLANDWWSDGDLNRRKLIRHGLRTLVKKGDPAALAVLGYAADSPVELATVSITPAVVSIGGSVKLSVELLNPDSEPRGALVDLVVHFVKANGSTGPKVFKGGELELAPGARDTINKTISVRQHTTRTHYPGRHLVDVQINGTPHAGGHFDIQ